MGVWNAPFTAEAMSRLENLMAAPLPAHEAQASLRSLVGDDGLFDMILRAMTVDRNADVRPLVAVVLDEWVDWTPVENWQRALAPSIRARAAALVPKFTNIDVAAMTAGDIAPEDPREAIKRLRFEPGTLCEVVGGVAPGTFVITHSATGDMYRVEVVWGSSVKAPETLAGPLRERYFPTYH
jgi:hypothetical protein